MSNDIENEVIGKFIKKLIETENIDHKIATMLQESLGFSQLPKPDSLADSITAAIDLGTK
ncbi:hypothetical protein [Natronoglycomyces albus]|uniref:Uncharacterized protein n=1 Tax=Natronoglycomyces albus TaxID=2811108 RepID=A0A895XT43_9ACTN|nr:hypothetical protein [Natronoglycomyces albus]QSB06663.1 hypothetical protein JQS30_07145 [Natronoglycomyces albus]